MQILAAPRSGDLVGAHPGHRPRHPSLLRGASSYTPAGFVAVFSPIQKPTWLKWMRGHSFSCLSQGWLTPLPRAVRVGAGLLGSGRGGQKQHPNPPMPPCSQHFFLCILFIPGTRAADGPQDAGRDKALLTLPEAAFPPLDSINYDLF